MDEVVEYLTTDVWRGDLGIGKATDSQGRKVFLHRHQFKKRDGPRWISADPPEEIPSGTPLVGVTEDASQDRRATKWALASNPSK